MFRINVLVYSYNRQLNRLDLKYTHCRFLFRWPVEFIAGARLDFDHYFADTSRLHKRKCGFDLRGREPAFRKQGFELAIVDELCRFREDSAEMRLTNAR